MADGSGEQGPWRGLGAPADWLAAAAALSGEAVVVTDLEGRIRAVNPAFERLTGYSGDEVAGRTPALLKSGRHEPSVYRELWAAITSGSVWRGALVNRRKDGSELHVHATIGPWRHADGSPGGYVAVEEDRTEITALERRVRRSQRLEAVGSLTEGIAHEFNNILYVIMGFTELAQLRASSGRGVETQLEEVLEGVGRARELVAQLLSVGRRDEESPRAIQLHPTVKEAVKLLRAGLPATVEVRQEVDSAAPPVVADPIRIHQAVMGLATQLAALLVGQRGVLHVRLESRRASSGSGGVHAADHVRIVVAAVGEDAGGRPAGSDPEDLADVRKVVDDHGGVMVRLEQEGSEVGFAIDLPAVPGAGHGEAESALALPGGTERILVVDDDPRVLDLQRELLQALGYRVDTAPGGAEALARVAQRPEALDLVISDLTMPGMTGLELAVELRSLRADLPVVLCTGYGDQAARPEPGLGVRAVLAKPVLATALARAVREVLDHPG